MHKKTPFNTFAPAVLTLILFLITLLLFYPGGMSGDSLGQWREVLLWELNSWSPPAMVYMWKLWSYVFYGPFALLFFHSLTYWIAIYFFSEVIFEKIWLKIIGILLLGFFPPIWLLVGTVWKDTSLLVSFFLSYAIIIYVDHFEKNKLLLIIALFFILYGASTRHNALIACLPLIVLLINVAAPALNKYINLSISLIIFSLIGLTIHQFNTHMVHHRMYNVSNSIFFWDLWGMSIDQNKNLMPKYIFHRNKEVHGTKHITMDELKKHYSPYCNTVIWPTSTGLRGDRYTKSFPDEKFKKDFLCAIIQYPESYIKVRKRAFECLLGISCNTAKSGSYLGIANLKPGHFLHEYSQKLKMGSLIIYPKKYREFTETYFFNGWFYLLGCFFVLLIASCIYFYSRNIYLYHSALLSLSGILYCLPYIVIAPCKDFRYITWMVLCFLLSFLLLFKVFLTERNNLENP